MRNAETVELFSQTFFKRLGNQNGLQAIDGVLAEERGVFFDRKHQKHSILGYETCI